MNQTEFLASIRATYEKGVGIIEKKNADYAGVLDPFKNFRSASVANISVSQAIIVRVLDKLSRVSNLLDREAMVLDESKEDTILDAINYLAILLAYLQANKPVVKTEEIPF